MSKQDRQNTKLEYVIAGVGGLLGGIVGLGASLLTLHLLSKKFQGQAKWLRWAAIGIIGAPIGQAMSLALLPTDPSTTPEPVAQEQVEEVTANSESKEDTSPTSEANESYPASVTKTGLDFSYDADGQAKVEGNSIIVRYLQIDECGAEASVEELRQEWETKFDLNSKTWTDRVKPIQDCLGNSSSTWMDFSDSSNPFDIDVSGEQVVLKADALGSDGSVLVDDSQVMRIDKAILEAVPNLANNTPTPAATPQTLADLPDGQYHLIGSQFINGISGNYQNIPLKKQGNTVTGYAILYPDDNACFKGTIEGNQIVNVTYANPPYGGSDLWSEPRQGEPLDINGYQIKTEDVPVDEISYCQEGIENASNQPIPTGSPIPEAPAVLIAEDPGAKINVRTQATASSTASNYGVPGDNVVLLKRAEGRDGFTWYQVRFEKSGVVGWVRGDFIDQKPVPTASPTSNAPVRAAYTGGNCDCPYDVMSNGRACGSRSAYSKPGGESPICYESDRP